MSTQSLEPVGREPTPWHGELQQWSHFAEPAAEYLAPSLIASDENAVQGAPVNPSDSLQVRPLHACHVLASQPTVIQATVISLAATYGIVLGQVSGGTLYPVDRVYQLPLPAIVLGVALIVLVRHLGLCLCTHLGHVTDAAITGVATLAGCALLEWAELNNLTGPPQISTGNFIQWNEHVLALAVLVGLWSAWRALRDGHGAAQATGIAGIGRLVRIHAERAGRFLEDSE